MNARVALMDWQMLVNYYEKNIFHSHIFRSKSHTDFSGMQVFGTQSCDSVSAPQVPELKIWAWV